MNGGSKARRRGAITQVGDWWVRRTGTPVPGGGYGMGDRALRLRAAVERLQRAQEARGTLPCLTTRATPSRCSQGPLGPSTETDR